jgi:hypothetical protein
MDALEGAQMVFVQLLSGTEAMSFRVKRYARDLTDFRNTLKTDIASAAIS